MTHSTESQFPKSARSPSMNPGPGLVALIDPRRLDDGAAGHASCSPPSRSPLSVRRTTRRGRLLRALGWRELEPAEDGAPTERATAGWSPREIMTKDLRRGDVFVWRTQLQMVARTVLLDSGMYAIVTRGAYSDPDAPQMGELAPREHFPRELFLVIARRVSIDAWQD